MIEKNTENLAQQALKNIEFVQDGVRHQEDGHLQEGAERFDTTNSDGGRHFHMLRPLHHLHACH